MSEDRYEFGEIVSLNAALYIYAMGVQIVVEDGRYLRINKEEE